MVESERDRILCLLKKVNRTLDRAKPKVSSEARECLIEGRWKRFGS